MRNLNISKLVEELLAPRLQGWNLLTKMFKCRTGKTSSRCPRVFSEYSELVYGNDVEGLLQELGCTHKPEGWRRFVDSSKFSLKTVLLHNGNIHPPLQTAHCVHMKETYENKDLLLKYMSYSKCGLKSMWRP